MNPHAVAPGHWLAEVEKSEEMLAKTARPPPYGRETAPAPRLLCSGTVRRKAMNIHSVIGLAVFAGLILPTPAQAVDRFGVVCVKNKTDVTILYRVQENNGEWRVKSLQPGWEQAFVHKYSRPNENRSPELDIQFDSDLRAQRQFAVKYKLPRRAATGDSCGEGAQYQFEYDRGNRLFIDLKRVS
jgi:hypothetical protein